MWVNGKYEVKNSLTWLENFVKENTLSTIITHTPVRVAHMPVELVRHESGKPKLMFHMPLVDPIAKVITDQRMVTIVIHGPQQYISPGLYQDPGLPTYNYGVAEVTDHCRELSDTELTEHMHRLIEQRETMFSESTGHTPWTLDDIFSQARFDRLLPMIIGFEVDLGQLELKLKMGQNRTDEDRRFMIDQLRTTEGVEQKVTTIMESLL